MEMETEMEVEGTKSACPTDRPNRFRWDDGQVWGVGNTMLNDALSLDVQHAKAVFMLEA